MERASNDPTATRRGKCAVVRRGESSYNERSVEFHFHHHGNRIGAKLPIEYVVQRDPIFVSGNNARDNLQTSLYALAIRSCPIPGGRGSLTQR